MKTKLCRAELEGLGNMESNQTTRRAQTRLKQEEAIKKGKRHRKRDKKRADKAVSAETQINGDKPFFCRRRH